MSPGYDTEQRDGQQVVIAYAIGVELDGLDLMIVGPDPATVLAGADKIGGARYNGGQISCVEVSGRVQRKVQRVGDAVPDGLDPVIKHGPCGE